MREPRAANGAAGLGRLARPLSLAGQVEQLLRQAIADGRPGSVTRRLQAAYRDAVREFLKGEPEGVSPRRV